MNKLKPDRMDLILYAGCGSGRFSLRIVRTVLVVVLDFSLKSLMLLRIRAKKPGLDIYPVLSDIRYIPINVRSIAGIASIEVVHTCPRWIDRIRSIQEFHSILKEREHAR